MVLTWLSLIRWFPCWSNNSFVRRSGSWYPFQVGQQVSPINLKLSNFYFTFQTLYQKKKKKKKEEKTVYYIIGQNLTTNFVITI